MGNSEKITFGLFVARKVPGEMGNHDFVYLLHSSLPVAALLNMMVMMMTSNQREMT